jgi:hypothetical protein
MREIEMTSSSPFNMARADLKRALRAERNMTPGTTAYIPNTAPSSTNYASLESMTVAALLAQAKASGFKATTKTRKADLIKMLSV